MLFNSATFFVFFVVVYGLYLVSKNNYRVQNALLLVGSYVFYGWWDVRFIPLIAGLTIINYYCGKSIAKTGPGGSAKIMLTISVASGLGVLGFFKYFNFFLDSAAAALHALGMNPDIPTMKIILPVGISFYTFQALSYTIDVYRGKMKPAKSLPDFALFVSFFPQLVAGPIERAANLLPQVSSPRKIVAEQVDAGIFLILWGYFKKVVVADNVAVIANRVFNGYSDFHGLDIVVGVLAFTVQIYCDFSGYSDIARGLAKLMGFELMVNFRLPYFARNPREFWQRWHVSLSTWLRDYLYIPLGGGRGGRTRTYVNILITMVLCGLWHGAAWNFVAWGAYHGLLQLAYRVAGGKGNRDAGEGGGVAAMALMFFFAVAGWVFFRASSMEQIIYMFTNAGLAVSSATASMVKDFAFYVWPLVAIQVWQHRSGDLLAPMKMKLSARAALYSFMVSWIFIFGVRKSVEFIYFQF